MSNQNDEFKVTKNTLWVHEYAKGLNHISDSDIEEEIKCVLIKLMLCATNFSDIEKVRSTITSVEKAAKELGYRFVYGDTDSIAIAKN